VEAIERRQAVAEARKQFADAGRKEAEAIKKAEAIKEAEAIKKESWGLWPFGF